MAAMMSVVFAMRPNNNDARLGIVARSDNDNRRAVVVRTILVVVRARVSMVIRPPDHDLAVEVGIAKTDRYPDARLRLRDPTRQSQQQSDNHEDPFHSYLLSGPHIRKEHAITREFVSSCCITSWLGNGR